MTKAAGVEKLIEDSFRFSLTHKGQKYRHAIPCEACFRLGLAEGAAVLTGEKPGEVLIRLEDKVKS
jgi:hypothetical protein